MHINISITKLIAVFSTTLLLVACEEDFSNPVDDTSSYSAGSTDLSKVVTIGDSLTAGYADSALYLSGQQNSYPAILAEQFAKVGGGSFSQPLMNDNLGGLLLAGNPIPDFENRLVLDASTQSPEPIAGTPTTDIAAPLTGSFNNMGVPGAKSFHLVAPGYGNIAGVGSGANPYFVRFASSATTSVIADAAAQVPSFIVLWIGNNDVLSYATSGGSGTDQTGNLDPATYGFDDITDPTVFGGIYTQLVGALTTANPDVQGVLINIPDVGSIPFFTTVPYNPIPLDQATADALNTGFASYNAGIQNPAFGLSAAEITKRTISFNLGNGNAPIISDETLTDLTGFGVPSLRQATADDLIVLTARKIIGKENTGPTDVWGLSATSPLGDEDVLIPSEISAIETATAAYNASIKAIADANPNLVLFDAATLLADLKASGIDYGTGKIEATYATGGGFSLDGVHPTARGYAVVANAIIDTINSGFSANIPKVDPGARTTIFLK